jgi:hypothetical protein
VPRGAMREDVLLLHRSRPVVIMIAKTALSARLGGLAVRSWRNASSADPHWGATARFRGVAAKVLHYPTRIWHPPPVLTSGLTLC